MAENEDYEEIFAEDLDDFDDELEYDVDDDYAIYDDDEDFDDLED